jgi:hypothetical protein
MRSPNYPAYGLAETVQMAKAIWDKENRTAVSPEVLVKALGYNSLSGIARVKLASLRKFGMLEPANGGLRISDLAMKVIHHPKGSAEHVEGLKEAALKPELYKELHGSHPNASDDALRSYLITRKAFSEGGAGQFIEAFRETLRVANLNGSGYNPGGGDDEAPDEAVPGIKVGDRVQWESQGVYQFPEPRRVQSFSKDRQFAFVEGTSSGLPVSQLSVVAAEEKRPMREPQSHSGGTLPPVIPLTKAYSWALSGDVKASLHIEGSPEAEDLDLLRDYIEITIKALKRKRPTE